MKIVANFAVADRIAEARSRAARAGRQLQACYRASQDIMKSVYPR